MMSLLKLTQSRILSPIFIRCSNKFQNQNIAKKFSSQEETDTSQLQHKATNKTAAITEKEYKTIYKFQYVNHMSLIGKLKMYQSAACGIMICGSCILNQIGLCTSSEVTTAIGMTIGGLIPVYLIGFLAHNLVGFVYLHNSGKKAKVAYLDFWGNRKDNEVLIKDIIPFEHLPASITDKLYMRIKLNSSKNEMKICTKYGATYDSESFNKIF